MYYIEYNEVQKIGRFIYNLIVYYTMVLKKVNLVRVKDLNDQQKEELNVTTNSGLVAIEVHTPGVQRKAVEVDGLLSYIIEG